MGLDVIHPRVLREMAAALTEPLPITYQQPRLTGVGPAVWGSPSVTPVCRKGRREDPGNQGPGSPTPVPGKVMEPVGLSAGTWHGQDSRGTGPSQRGAVQGGSCWANRVSFRARVTHARDGGKAVGAAP